MKPTLEFLAPSALKTPKLVSKTKNGVAIFSFGIMRKFSGEKYSYQFG
ncbi:hypothetical protein HCU40_14545 [Pseudanabaena biceps]|nr:hypothetical protein [Pseudanabaena biceps]